MLYLLNRGTPRPYRDNDNADDEQAENYDNDRGQ